MALRFRRGCMVIKKWPSFCGYGQNLARTIVVESQEDVPDPLASQQQRSNRSLQWVQKNGQIGHRRRIFRRPRVAMCWQYVHSSASHLPGRCFTPTASLPSSFIVRGPSRGEWRRNASAVMLGRCSGPRSRTRSHRMVRIGLRTRGRYMSKVCVADVPLWSECSKSSTA